MPKSIFLFITFILNFCFLQCEEKENDSPPKIGNFALPMSQQPAALFGFGGNIIDKDELQLYCFADAFSGRNRLVTDVIPSVLYGITNKLSVFVNFPFTPRLKSGGQRSQGLEDFFTQLEYAFYEKVTPMYQDQATIVGNFTVPTGSVRKTPQTGFGSPSFFLGGTFYRVYVDWFLFTSQGVELMTWHRGTKISNQYLYQFGIGRNFPSPEGWIYAWMLELDGQYGNRNRIRGEKDPNSGGNVIYATPSLWISNKNLLLQCGFSFPVTQHWYGNQNDINIAFNLNVAWAFYPK